MIKNSFSVYKIIQILSYIQEKTDVKHYISLLKLIFFADKYHIRNYGITLSGDMYIAKQNGPVPINTFKLLTNDYADISTLSLNDIEEINKKIINDNRREIKVSNIINLDFLSKSDVEALDFTINKFSKFSKDELVELTHEYDEWKKHEQELKTNNEVNIDIVDFFSELDISKSKLIKQNFSEDPFIDDKEYLNDMKEEFVFLSKSL